jgi:hypothetical protein
MLRAIVKALPFVLPAAVVVAGAACSSSTSNNCTGLGSTMLDATCESCAMSSCSTSYSSYTAVCCTSGVPAAVCETEASALEQCLLTSCSSKCQVSTSGSSTTSSGGSLGPHCKFLSACCPLVDTADQPGCEKISAEKNEAECATVVMDYQAAGMCN